MINVKVVAWSVVWSVLVSRWYDLFKSLAGSMLEVLVAGGSQCSSPVQA